MTVRVNKPAINVREELADLRKPTGIAGEAMLRAETPQEQFNLIGAGRRNLIINGAMQVAQRGTSFTSPSNVYTLDRWFSTDNTGASVTVSQDSDAPDGFTNSAKITVNTADTSLATNSVCLLRQNIEGVNFSQCGFGSGSAKDVTISFWVKSSITGQYSVAINNAAYDRSYVAGYTISSANTWEYKSVKITGDTSGTWLNSFSIGAAVHFPVAVEAGKITSGGAWTSGFNYGVTGQVNFVGTTGATFQITGVQLELGKVATPFEHRSYGEELALCQRYYTQTNFNVQAYHGASTFASENIHWQQRMRATPTTTLTAGTTSNVSTTYVYDTTDNGCRIEILASNDGRSIHLGGIVNADAEL